MAFGDIVQSNSGTSTTATTTPTLGLPTTAGNLIVLTFASDDYNGTVSAGWTQSSEMEQQTFHGGYVWWAKATAGMTIPSYTIGSAVRSAWTLVEYQGPFDASPYDVSEGQFTTSSSQTYTTPSMTPTAGDRLMVAGLQWQNGLTNLIALHTFTNSFTEADGQLFNDANPRLSISQLKRVVTANGSTAYSTGGSSTPQNFNSATGLIIAFKAGAAGVESFIREVDTGTDWRETESGAIRITEGTFFVRPAIDASVAESASAGDTITATRAYTSAVAETMAAAETVGRVLLRQGAIAESASAGEVTVGLLIGTKAITETAAAAETITYSLTGAAGTVYNVTQAEVAVAVDSLIGRLTALRAVVETAAAAETITASLLGISVAIAETTAAVETIGATVIALPQIYDVTVAESASAADTLTADIRRWERDQPPPWANWVEEATAAAGWTRTAHASASWTSEDAETGDWLLETRPVNQWTKE